MGSARPSPDLGHFRSEYLVMYGSKRNRQRFCDSAAGEHMPQAAEYLIQKEAEADAVKALP